MNKNTVVHKKTQVKNYNEKISRTKYNENNVKRKNLNCII